MLRQRRMTLLVLGLTMLELASLAGGGLDSSGIAENKFMQKELPEAYSVEDAASLSASMDYCGNWPGSVSVNEAGNVPRFAPLEEPNGPPEMMIQSWRGFALQGNESYSLRISIESLRPVEAMNVRKLMASNMTLEEMRSEIRREEGNVTHRGVLRIGDDIFRLDNISMTPKGNKTDLNAEVSEWKFGSSQNNTSIIVGYMNASLIEEDGSAVSHGILSMRSEKYVGTYSMLLYFQPWKGRREAGDL